MQEGGKKSFRYEEIETEYLLPSRSGVLVPYLDGIKLDLKERD